MAAGQTTQRRQVGTKSFTSFGDEQPLELKGLLPLRSLDISVVATIDNAAGSGLVNGTARYDEPHSMCGEFVLTENGGPNLHKVPGDLLADFLQAMWKTRPAGTGLGTSTGTGLVQDADYSLPFSTPRSFSDFPDDTAYLAQGKSIVLSVKLGNLRTAGAGTGGFYHSDHTQTGAFSSASYAVEAVEVVGMGEGLVRGKAIPMITYQRDVQIATNPRLQRIFNQGASYRLWLAKMLASIGSGATSFTPNASILNNVTFETGLGTQINMTARKWRYFTKRYLQESTAAGRTGLYAWDFAGLPSQTSNTLDTSKLGTCAAYYDVTKPTYQGDIVTGILVLLPVGAASA